MSSKPSDPTTPADGSSFVARCTIIGGPNGSGKSSIFDWLQADGEFVNADIIARRLNPENPKLVERAAAEATLDRLNELLRDRKDFVFETTLSGNNSIMLMKRANEAKYEVGLVYVVLSGVLGNSRGARRSVLVSNGKEVAVTDADGRYTLPLPDEAVIFDIKPAGFMSPVDPVTNPHLPRFFRLQHSDGSPASLNLTFEGVPPTGPLPASVDFALRRQDEPEAFEVVMFTDPQPETDVEIDFIRECAQLVTRACLRHASQSIVSTTASVVSSWSD